VTAALECRDVASSLVLPVEGAAHRLVSALSRVRPQEGTGPAPRRYSRPAPNPVPGVPPPAGVGHRRAPRYPSRPDRRRGCSTFLHPPSGGVPGQACLQACNPSTFPG